MDRDEDYYRTWKNILIYLCIKNSIMKVDKVPILLLKNLIMRSGILSLLNEELKEFDKKKLNYFKELLMNTYEILG